MLSEKEKNSRDKELHVQKNLYFDIKSPYQVECMELLRLCGRRQARMLGLMAHEFIINHGLNLNNVSKEQLKTYMKLMELNSQNGFSSMTVPIDAALKNDNALTVTATDNRDSADYGESLEEPFMDEDGMLELSNALSAWGI